MEMIYVVREPIPHLGAERGDYLIVAPQDEHPFILQRRLHQQPYQDALSDTRIIERVNLMMSGSIYLYEMPPSSETVAASGEIPALRLVR